MVGHRVMRKGGVAEEKFAETQHGEYDRPIVAVVGRSGEELPQRLSFHPGKMAGGIIVEVSKPQCAMIEPDGGQGDQENRNQGAKE